jgi:hypothetical protein
MPIPCQDGPRAFWEEVDELRREAFTVGRAIRAELDYATGLATRSYE